MDNLMANATRNIRIDIIKGISIIMMVYGHTFGIFRDFIYLFHMPVFFMVSGYCWNERHAADKAAARNYFFDRLERLLVPYWICNVLYLITQNIFLKGGVIYTNNPKFLKFEGATPINQVMTEFLGVKQIILFLYRIIRFEFIPQLGGPTWFLYVLFMVCVIHCFLDYLIQKIKNHKIRIVYWGLIFIIASILAWAISEGAAKNWIEPRHYKIPAAYVAYLLGVFVKKYCRGPRKRVFQISAVSISFIILLVALQFGSIELSQAEITNPAFYIMCSLSGWIMLDAVAGIIEEHSKWISFIGKHTLPIVFMHCFAFKSVSWIYVLVKGLPLYMVASYPVIFGTSEFVKWIYTAVGVALPIGLMMLYVWMKEMAIADFTQPH